MNRTDNKLYGLILGGTMFCMAVLLAALLLFGCTTQHKAVKYMEKHKELAIEYCGSKFPCVDSVRETIRYVDGEPIITVKDSLVYVTDTVNNTIEKVKVKYITKTINTVDTVYYDRIVKQSDKTVEARLQAKLDVDNKTIADLQKSDRTGWYWAKWGWALIAIALFVWGCKLILKYRV